MGVRVWLWSLADCVLLWLLVCAVRVNVRGGVSGVVVDVRWREADERRGNERPNGEQLVSQQPKRERLPVLQLLRHTRCIDQRYEAEFSLNLGRHSEKKRVGQTGLLHLCPIPLFAPLSPSN